MKNEYCKGCDKKKECATICPELESHLSDKRDRATALSSDYIDKAFPSELAADILRERRYDLLQRRGREARPLLNYFSAFGSLAVRFFWMWQLKNQECLKNEEIAIILGISESRVSQIFKEIKNGMPKRA